MFKKNKKAILIALAVVAVAVVGYYLYTKNKKATSTNVVGAPAATPAADKLLRDRASMGY